MKILTREEAVERINFINELIEKERYLEIQKNINEDLPPINIFIYKVIGTESNELLENILQRPYYRFLRDEIYSVVS